MSRRSSCTICRGGKNCTLRLGVWDAIISVQTSNGHNSGMHIRLDFRESIFVSIASACQFYELWKGRQPWEFHRNVKEEP